ncbi:MAG: ParB/RepB/Spo0J family partition protein [Nitrosopumilus sp.]|nr:ParB/RepB/Spo0J family partition protein [Nitrosopumilus sp.]
MKQSLVFHKVETVPISKVHVWDEVEARKLNLEGIKELASSIKNEGLQNPPVVQKTKDGKYKLIAGQRRLEALKRIGSKNIPVLVVKHPYDDENAKAVSIIENLHRKQMNSSEMAEACDFLVKSMKSSKKAATALGISQQTLRSYSGFNSVPEKLQQLVPKVISRNEALQLYKIVPKVDDAVEIANRIRRYSPPAKKRYFEALALDPTAPHATIRRMANHFKEKQNIRIKLTKQQSKFFSKAATESSTEPNELATKIISQWLSRKGYK